MLYGERVEILKSAGNWHYIYAPEQGLFGWVEQDEVEVLEKAPTHVICDFDHELPYGSFGKEGRDLSAPFSREQLVKDALQFLGAPYLWGGRAHYQKKPIGSVDCSGLINLVYRAQGILIPRNSRPQALFAKETQELLPGDMIYLGDPVTHVIMKIDEHYFIEAPETGKSVRLLKWGRDIWENEKKLCFFDREKQYPQHYRRI